MHSISVETRIAASPEIVWSTLTDFAGYPDWNPFIRRLEGDLCIGGRLKVVLQPDGSAAATFRPTIVEFEPGKSFTWLGRTLVRGVFDGRHHFELRPISGGTLLEQSERFEGFLVPLLQKMLGGAERGFRKMNDVVKLRAEAADHGDVKVSLRG